MSCIPSKEEIALEVENYNELSFLKKSKNILALFIIALSALSTIILFAVDGVLKSGAGYEIFAYIALSVFIFLNHRWAMIVFCFLYLIDKFIFIIERTGSPASQIIFGVLATVLTYSAFMVAMGLKNKLK